MDIPYLLSKYAPGLEWSLSGRIDPETGVETYHLEDLCMHKDHQKPSLEEVTKWHARLFDDLKNEAKLKDIQKHNDELRKEYVDCMICSNEHRMLEIKEVLTKNTESLKSLVDSLNLNN